MASLLGAVAKHGMHPGYARRLLQAAEPTEHRTAHSLPGDQGLIAPLSDRELDVLRLLGRAQELHLL